MRQEKKKRVSAVIALLLVFAMLFTGFASSFTTVSAAQPTEFSNSEKTEKYYAVAVNETKNGTVEVADASNLQAGTQVALTITPDKGYHLMNLAVLDENQNVVQLTDENGQTLEAGNFPDVIRFILPESNVNVYAQFQSDDGSDASVWEDDGTNSVSPAEIFDLLNANRPLAVSMNSVALYSVPILNTAYLHKPETLQFSYHEPNGHVGPESLFKLGDYYAWCVEPSQTIGDTPGLGLEYTLDSYSGDALNWLRVKYGWSYQKIIQLSRAVEIAKETYKSDEKCAYVLVQNLIWSSIKAEEDAGESGYYLLTDQAAGSKYYCTHFDTLDKVNAAIQDVWYKTALFETKPSYDGATIYATAGQSYWQADSNNVSDSASVGFVCPSGVSIQQASGGILIDSDASLAGQSMTVNFWKKGLMINGSHFEMPVDSHSSLLIYTRTGKQTVSIWSGALSPVYGSFRIVFGRTGYLTAAYKAADAVSPMLDLYIEKTDAETGDTLAGAKFDVYMDDVKVDTVTTDNDGKAVYHYRGDAIWTDYVYASRDVLAAVNWTASYNEAKQDVLNQLETLKTAIRTNTTHKWKVVEIEAPQGYKINDQVWEQIFDLNTTAIEVSFTDEAENGHLKLVKESADPDLTAGNACYSLAGAVYGVYATTDDAVNDTNRIDTLTTDETGNSNVISIGEGVYFVKEITASKGYLICSEQSDDVTVPNGVHKVKVEGNEITSFVCKEKPGNDPFALTLQKMDADTKSSDVLGDANLNGAIFELAYYENTDGDTTGNPARVWYFKTANNGIIDGYLDCNNKDYLLDSYTSEDGTIYKSDKLFINSDGEIQYPIGTYTFKEAVAPRHFQKEGYMHFIENTTGKTNVNDGLKAIIKQDKNGEAAHIYDGNNVITGAISASNLAIKVYEEKRNGSITLYKRSADSKKTPLEGVSFKMVGLDTKAEYEATTDKDGKIVWDDLVPQKYIITEVKTLDGLNLLKDNIEVTLPMEMTREEAEEKGADLTQAVYDEATGKYCFYDLTFTIDNSVIFNMPITGGNQNVLYFVLIGGLAAVGCGLWIAMKKKK